MAEKTAKERLDAMIVKVQGLIRKAEGTDIAEEADVFFAKAQEMMTKHGIDEAILRLAEPEMKPEEVLADDMIIKRSGYFESMVRLAQVVSFANGVRCLIKTPKDFGTEAGIRFIGFESDIMKTKMMWTALLASCVRERRTVPEYVREMESVQKGYMGKWRVDFSVGYATRIGTRLAEIKQNAEREATDADTTGSLLPALRNRSAEVDRYLAAMAGKPRKVRAKHYNEDAFNRGQDAAERADLGQQSGAVGGRRQEIR